MELLLKNGKRVITMDYTYLSGNGNTALYQRENNVVSSLFNGTPSELKALGELEYTFDNGSRIRVYSNDGFYINARAYDNKNNEVDQFSTSQKCILFLKYFNYHSGAYNELDEFGKKTLRVWHEIYRIDDLPKQTETQQPITVNLEGRGYDKNSYPQVPQEVKATNTGINNSSNVFYKAIVEGSIAPTDPYHPGGGPTKPGGGEGDVDDTSDPIDIPNLPSLSAVDAGFITLFNPTIVEVNNLAKYMWSDLFNLDGWKKIFADPMQAILGLSIVPVSVPNGGTREVTVGNIPTGITMNLASTQYVSVDCGTLNVHEYWGAYLDYDPYTKFEIYLPYIGTHSISSDDIMGKAVHVVYHIDILTGSCCAYVKCGDSVLYSFIGQCASPIPVTGDNWASAVSGALNIAGSIGSMVATGGMSAPLTAGIASSAVNSIKPRIEKSGALSGTGGLLGVQTPYLIITRPKQALPKFQNTYTGYPSFITSTLSDLQGYTTIYSIHLKNVPATQEELNEIENLLKQGVIL